MGNEDCSYALVGLAGEGAKVSDLRCTRPLRLTRGHAGFLCHPRPPRGVVHLQPHALGIRAQETRRFSLAVLDLIGRLFWLCGGLTYLYAASHACVASVRMDLRWSSISDSRAAMGCITMRCTP